MRQRVVVGVDGSPATTAAIRWAVEQARNRQVRLHVVHAYYWPPSVAGWHAYTATRGVDLASLEKAAHSARGFATSWEPAVNLGRRSTEMSPGGIR